MEVKLLSTFVAVANRGSFTQAAEQLSYAQSSVTSQVQMLEDELGVKLFERLGKSIALTEEGKRLLPYARRILNLCEEAREAVSPAQGLSGPLVIGAPESLFAVRLAPLLAEYHRMYPDVEISLRFGSCDEFTEQLREGSIDVAFYIDSRSAMLPFVTLKQWTEPMALLVAPGNPLAAGRKPITAGDLAGATLILTEGGCSYRDMFLRLLNDEGVAPGSTLESSSVQVMKQLAMDGFGVTLLPRVAALDELAGGRLSELIWDGRAADMNDQMVKLVRHRDKWVSPVIRAFIDLAERTLPADPA